MRRGRVELRALLYPMMEPVDPGDSARRELYEQLLGPRRLYQSTRGDHYLGALTPVQRRWARYRRLGLVHRELMAPVIDEIASLARRESPRWASTADLPDS